MYTVKNWETIKGKKFGEKPQSLDIDKIMINIEKIIIVNLETIKKDLIIANDTTCSGKVIYN